MKRYIAMHKDEPGYETPDDVQKQFIDKQEEPDNWRVATVVVDTPNAELVELLISTREREIRAAVDAAIKNERQRIRNNLTSILFGEKT